jgi:DNA-binding transcriptional LysR family regulator
LPRIGEFLQQYPDLELILCSSDNVEDIIQEGFDCVIRTGQIEDSTTLVARPLARYRWMVLASPAWLAAHGRPQSIDDLHQHRAVGYLNHRTGRTIDWLFSLDDGDCAIRMQETLVVDDTDAYIQAGVQGLGLIRVASYLAQPYLQSGALVACLEQAASDLPLSLVYPQNRYLPPAVRAFYDWSRRVLQPRSARPDVGGIRSRYGPRMACFILAISQFSAGSCARRL